MKTENHPLKISQILSLIFTLFSASVMLAQTYTLNNDASKLSVFGTSSLHDWEMVAEQKSGSISLNTTAETPSISALNLKVVAESLESGKSGMDKNAYKALKTDDHKSIDFKMVDIQSITSKGNGVYAVKTTGNLTIAGTTKTITLNFNLTLTDNKVKLNGNYTFKMTQFKVEPPTAMFGTITTGDELKIEFNIVLQ
ncbi:YceI family protein [Formosa sediminum]|uniref:YceI family protein n=1 Tax=Formosa sediminum TaxID=2594004 RepID=A0A516GUY0_9FLAO|nr:YceI family protein [Formosa sediminum]QDO95323.1 YceI family protein [Formosa sediminum]